MPMIKAVLDFFVILLLLRLLIRANEAFFHPIYRLIYRITDFVLTPARYLTRTPTQGILLTLLAVVVIRGAVYVSMYPWPLEAGVGNSFLDLFRLLFQAYMVIWVVGVLSGRGYRTPMIHMVARAFLPVDTALARLGIPRSRFHVGAFLLLWFLYGLLNAAIRHSLILKITPSLWSVVEGLGEGLVLFIRLFPFPGFFSLVIIVGALMSWVSPDPSNPVVQTIYGISEPLLRPFRRLIPHLGGLDISPIFALLAFQILGHLALQMVMGLMRSLQAGAFG